MPNKKWPCRRLIPLSPVAVTELPEAEVSRDAVVVRSLS